MTVDARLIGRGSFLLIAASCAAGMAHAQQLGQAPASDISWIRVTGALLLCILLAVAGAFVLKNRLGGRLPAFSATSKRRLELVECLRLGHQAQICLVRFDEREVVVAVVPGRVEFLPGWIAARSDGAPQ